MYCNLDMVISLNYQTNSVVTFIANQDKHHSKSTFKEEYAKLLEKFIVEYEDKYLFE